MSVQNRTVLVTGCSSGIGFATAVHLAGTGMQVIAGMRNPSGGAGPLLAAAGADAPLIKVVALDVDSDDSAAAVFEGLSRVDVVVNNAGITPAGPVEEFRISEWKAIFETNLFGAIRCTQAALPGMRERGVGCIVNIGSFGGRFPIPPISAYVASKAALAAFSEGSRRRSEAFRSTCRPSRSRLHSHRDPEQGQAAVSNQPLRRSGAQGEPDPWRRIRSCHRARGHSGSCPTSDRRHRPSVQGGYW